MSRGSQDRNLSGVIYTLLVLQKPIVELDIKRSDHFYRCGAEAARWAHNPEVIRSRRIAGIHPVGFHRVFFHFTSFTEAGCQAGHKTQRHFTPVAQRKRTVKRRLLPFDQKSDLGMVIAL